MFDTPPATRPPRSASKEPPRGSSADEHRAATAARRARERDARRAALLDAARAAMAEDGPRGLSIRNVGRRAGLSIGGVYGHFASIHHVKAALVADGHRSALVGVRRRVKRSDDAADWLVSVAESYLTALLERRRLFEETVRCWFDLDDDANVPDEVKRELREGVLEVIAPFEEAIRHGQAQGRFRSDRRARRVAAQLWGALNGIFMAFIVDPHRTAREHRKFLVGYAREVAESFVFLLEKGVR